MPGMVPQMSPQQRPRFADQVMGMRAVVATALACLIVGGLGGFALGRATGNGDNRMLRGPGMFQQRGAFPNSPRGGTGNGYGSGSGGLSPRFDGTPQRRFQGTGPQGGPQGGTQTQAPAQPPSLAPTQPSHRAGKGGR
jgi:hypothetical protein